METGNLKESLKKLESFCAYRERCEFEVREKLKVHGLKQTECEKIVETLKKAGFLDNARFAQAYASGKLRMKGWGKIKIREGLKKKHLPEHLITQALQSLDDEQYREIMRRVAEKKWKLLGRKSGPRTREKLFAFLFQRGFEKDLIYRLVGELTGE